jgi:prepilin-type N-terminal cleavage/methylation domain-containing protein
MRMIDLMAHFNRKNSHAGFTLIEALVVVSLIALLLAMLMPSLRAMKEEGRAIVCLTNQHAIGQAFRMYGDANVDAYPYGVPKPIATVDHPHNVGWRPDSSRGGGVPPQQQFFDAGYLVDVKAWVCPTDQSPQTYNWWDYTEHPDFTQGSSYMFSEDALFGVAWKDRIRLTFSKVFQPANFAYMSDGWMCPNGWSWAKIDPWDLAHVNPWDVRIDWSHSSNVNILFGDQHAERRPQRDARLNLREHPMKDY